MKKNGLANVGPLACPLCAGIPLIRVLWDVECNPLIEQMGLHAVVHVCTPVVAESVPH